jgi:hypothetical protein
VVGFAPSLNDFPFILNPSFPFEGDEGFLIDAARSDAAASDAGYNNVDVLASMPGPQSDSSTDETQIGMSGAGAVQFAEKSRSSEPTVETTASQDVSKRSKSSKQVSGSNSSARAQQADQGQDGESGRSYSLAKRQKTRGHERQQQEQQSSKDKSRHGNGSGHHAKQSQHHQKDKTHHKGKSGGKK